VRLRINLVAKFLRTVRPDVICLQETKCPDDKFPLKRFARLGYSHAALNGQKGYHGVAILSRLPLDAIDARSYFRMSAVLHECSRDRLFQTTKAHCSSGVRVSMLRPRLR
jgi:exonuclease III